MHRLILLTILCATQIIAAASPWPLVKSEMKPWTRWWWHGNAVTKSGIRSHLEEFKKAGIGGVEITSIYGVEGQEQYEIPYLSSDYLEIIRTTALMAKSLGLGVDLPTGSGWRCGGPQTTLPNADTRFYIKKINVPPGRTFRESFNDRPQVLIAISEYGDKIDLLDRLDWLGKLEWFPPAGNWAIYSVSQRWSGARVKRASVGGEGYSFNPFSRTSFEEMINPFTRAFGSFPRGLVRSQFHDSFEYSGNWTSDFFQEFQKRRGYDLTDHLPELNGEGNWLQVSRIKCDYRQTLAELLLENFILPWVEWSHDHGMLARNQAHGSPGNLLDLYGAVDIPETEIFRFDNYIDVLKFASSAANVMGRPLVSSETFTWQDEHFHVTLDTMKRSADLLFAAGINHIFFHGTTYSPPEAEWPGWLFYASTQVNPRNTIWHDLPAFNDYITRCQSLLQTSRPDNDVLVYWPVYDIWSHPEGLEQKLTVHHNQWIKENPAGKVASVLRENGYFYDFISDFQLKGTRVKDGKIATPGGLYQCVIVPDCQYMPVETLKSLIKLAENGATVLFTAPPKMTVPGFFQYEIRRLELKSLLGRYGLTGGSSRIKAGKGQFIVAEDPADALASLGIPAEPLGTVPGVLLNRRKMDDGHLYFIANHSSKKIDRFVDFSCVGTSAILMDPATGQYGVASSKPLAHGSKVKLQLLPGQSLFVKILDGAAADMRWAYYAETDKLIPLEAEWKIEFVSGGPVLPAGRTLDKLSSWTSWGDAEANRFAGTARYTCRFNAPAGPGTYRLDLGRVAESAVVFLNGKKIGTLFSRPFNIMLNNVSFANNELEILVTNLAANRIRDLDIRSVRWRIFDDINFVNIEYGDFDASGWPLAESGLIGPVTLTPVRLDP